MEKIKTIVEEFSKAVSIYEIITISEIFKNVDINHNYARIEFPKEFESSVKDVTIDEIISSINKECSYVDLDISFANINIMYDILGKLYDKLNDLVGNKQFEYCISILSILEINRFWAQGVTLWSRKIDFETSSNAILKSIIDILNSKSYEKNVDTYIFFDNYFARDKNALEMIFPVIFKNIDLEKAFDSKLTIFSLDIDLLLKYANSILQIYNMIDEFKRGDLKNRSLKINMLGYFEYPINDMRLRQHKYYNHILKSGEFYQSKYMDQMDAIIESMIGISNNNLKELSRCLQNFNGLCNDEYIIGCIDDLTVQIARTSNIDPISIRKLLTYVTYQMPNEYLDGKTHFDDKVTRKSLIKMNEYLLTPLGLFKTSISNIYVDIIHNQISDNNIKSKLSKVYGLMNEEFENYIFQKCKQELNYTFIKNNVQQKDICIDCTIVELPGEIDVLLLYRDILFVVECKNIAMRSTFDLINSIKIDFESIYKKSSFQNKLAKKVSVLQNNIDSVKKYIGVESEIKKVTGCIVTNGFYFMSDKENSNKFDVLVWSELIEWIKNYDLTSA